MFLQQHHAIEVVSGKTEYAGDRGSSLGYALHVDWLNSLTSPDQISIARFMDSPVANPSVMIRKQIFKRYGTYTTAPVPEDYELRLTRNHVHYSQEAFFNIKNKYMAKWLTANFKHLPEIKVFGSGKIINRRVSSLAKYNIPIKTFIDVKPYRSKNIIHFSELNGPNGEVVLSYVSDRNGKKLIEKYLTEKGYKAGKNFWMMA